VDPKTGEVIFVEVERDVSKDQISRKTKWMKFYEASNGNLYVFCDNLNCQRAIQGEINLALSGLSYNSFLTNLHGLRNGKRATRMVASGFHKEEVMKNRTVCTPFYLHRSSRVLRGKSVLNGNLDQIGTPICGESIIP